VRAVGCVAVMLACLALAGCRAPSGNAPGTAGVKPSLDLNAAAGQRQPGPPVNATPVGSTGVLAGQVLDNFNRRPPPTYIQVVAERSGNDPAAAPIEIAADKDGYFLIQGLQPGKHYQLVARAKDGTQLMAGSAWVTPPNPRVVIRISQELATTSTPPLPAAPTPPPTPPAPAAAAPTWPPARGDQAWAPGRPAPNALTPERPAGLGAPTADDAASGPTPRVPVDPTRIGAAETVRNDPPAASIPGADWSPANPSTAGEPPPIPFCSLTGRQLNDFALYDLNGQPWQWRQRNNKLTLIDFWGTWCPACLHAIPHLNVLHERYGGYGLEVVGVAYENGPANYHVEQVRRVAQRLHANYTLLLGGDRLTCPVRVQFRVVQWPTLFLVDDTGRIIWQESGLDRQKVNELDKLIRQKLGVR